MKKIIIGLCVILSASFAQSQTIFESAQKNAKDKHQLILLNFSGSDWCIPCIRMRKEIFENANFKEMSDSLLIFVNADFPRSKKNQVNIDTQKQNEALAEQYNPNGSFPYTLLMDADGKVIKTWDGFPKNDVISFTDEIRGLCNNYK